MFTSMSLQGWRQFEQIEVEFHPRLTILTGANGAGKTTILNILNRHAGWNLNFLATPMLTRRGAFRYFTGLWSRESDASSQQVQIGRIQYSSGLTAQLTVPSSDASTYSVAIQGQENIPGIFIPSHRPVNNYQAVGNIPTQIQTSAQLFNQYLNELRQRYQAGSRLQFSPVYRMKEALIAFATFGYGNEVVQRNDEYVRILEGFQRILRVVLPESLGFRRIAIRMPEVILETESGDFSLDAVSGGILSIIDMAWQLHMKSQEASEFAVMIDEPENHLHPKMQRSLLNDMVEAFPGCQFIVATHNPFIITSAPESNVYALDYTEQNRVISKALDLVDKAGTSNQILRDVLGVEVLMPEWVEHRVREVVRDYAARPNIDAAMLSELQADMERLGLGGLFPEAASRLADDVGGES